VAVAVIIWWQSIAVMALCSVFITVHLRTRCYVSRPS